MIYAHTVIEDTYHEYATLKKKAGKDIPAEIPSDQIRALCIALVKAINEERRAHEAFYHD